MNPTLSRWSAALRRATLPLLTALLVSCGGVGEEGTGIGTETTSVGMVQGLSDSTVTVNGVEYRRTAAAVTDGLGEPLDSGALRLGMWVEVNGTVPADDSGAIAAVAERIRVRPAARGVVRSVSPDGATIGVLDSTVTLGRDTVRDVGSAAPLTAGDVVEVHGPLGASAGTVAASRVERLAAAPQPVRYELRGRVSQLDTINQTMVVGQPPGDLPQRERSAQPGPEGEPGRARDLGDRAGSMAWPGPSNRCATTGTCLRTSASSTRKVSSTSWQPGRCSASRI